MKYDTLVLMCNASNASKVVWTLNATKVSTESTEKVQRRFTKRLRSLTHLLDDERLAKRGLPTLELRRLHLDLMFCYKVIFGLVSVNLNDFFTLSTVSTTRGHKYKLYKPQCCCSVRQMCFVERMINVWNSLPPTVSFSSLATFKYTIHCVNISTFLS